MNGSSKIQSEAQLEESLIKRLGGLGYDRVTIPDEVALLSNLKSQLEKFNKTQFSEAEFSRVLNHLDQGVSLIGLRLCVTGLTSPVMMRPPIIFAL